MAGTAGIPLPPVAAAGAVFILHDLLNKIAHIVFEDTSPWASARHFAQCHTQFTGRLAHRWTSVELAPISRCSRLGSATDAGWAG